VLLELDTALALDQSSVLSLAALFRLVLAFPLSFLFYLLGFPVFVSLYTSWISRISFFLDRFHWESR
jgi:heme O synthase-like polyprenyltransferase